MKQCRMCGEVKPEADFPWKNKAKGTLNTACKVCQREYAKNHYQSNTEKYKAKAKVARPIAVERNMQHLMAYLLANPCVDCGESDIIVLEFDHREPMLGRGYRVTSFLGSSLEKLVKEMAKCDVVCCNCHRRRTAKTFGWKRLDFT